MSYPVLQAYLRRLAANPKAGSGLTLDGQGRAHCLFRDTTLASAFQGIHGLASSRIAGFEALVRGPSTDEDEHGRGFAGLLDNAASDDESVALDRLSRILHAVNFFRQSPAPGNDLYLNVHTRLLAAVDDLHGAAFRHLLEVLELPREKIILQLPPVTQNQGWILGVVAANYRRNGFRLGLNAADVPQALALLAQVRPDVIKLAAHTVVADAAAASLLQAAAHNGVRLVFTHIDSPASLARVRQLDASSTEENLGQGRLWGKPGQTLPATVDAGAISATQLVSPAPPAKAAA
ncbi:MAG: EAL domain-containing protein [Pseudomonadota bacterium]